MSKTCSQQTRCKAAVESCCLCTCCNHCSTSGMPRATTVGVLGGGQLGRMMALAAVGHVLLMIWLFQPLCPMLSALQHNPTSNLCVACRSPKFT
jgi:hypothetical protein